MLSSGVSDFDGFQTGTRGLTPALRLYLPGALGLRGWPLRRSVWAASPPNALFLQLRRARHLAGRDRLGLRLRCQLCLADEPV